MKKIAALLFNISIMLSYLNVSGQWQQTGGPEGCKANCLAKVDSQIWVGTNRGIFVSNNEGITWQKSSLFSDNYIVGMLASNDTILVGYQAVDTFNIANIFSTVSFDGGQTWSNEALIDWFGSGASFTRVQNTIVCNNQQISYSFGASWIPFEILPDGHIYNIVSDGTMAIAEMINYSSGYMSLFRSDDGLHTWQLIDSAVGYNDMRMDNSQILCVYNSYDTIIQSYLLKSIDQCNTWDTLYKAPLGVLLYGPQIDNGIISMYASDNSNYYGLKSSDDGANWVQFVPRPIYRGINLSNGEILSMTNEGVVRYIPSQDTAYVVETGLKGRRITALYINKNTLFAGTEADIYISKNGGLTWQRAGLNFSYTNEMIFVGDTVITYSNNFVARSYDNGEHWVKTVIPDFSNDYYSMGCIQNRIFIVTDSFKYSDDYGATWGSLPDLPSSFFNDKIGNIRVFNNNLYCVTNDGIIYRYVMNNSTWDSITSFWSPGAHNANILYAMDTVLVMSGEDEFMTSSDGGLTWNNSPLNGLPIVGSDPIIPKRLINYNGLWIGLGSYLGVITSSDQGITWQPLQNSPTLFYPIGGLTMMGDILYSGSYYSSIWRRGGAFSSIGGKVFYDANNNNILDNGERGIGYDIVSLKPSDYTATTDNQGNYALLIDMYGDTIRPVRVSTYCTVHPDHYITTASAQNLDFAIQIPPNIADLSIDVTNANVFRPGFNTNLKLTVKNNGSLIQTPIAKVILNSSFEFIESTPAAVVIGDTLTWLLSPIDFLEQQIINIQLKTTSTTPIGSLVTCLAEVSPIINDVIPTDNRFVLTQPVVGSFDPNDKQCKQGSVITTEQVEDGEELEFTIRFQNTGNYQADFVHITDTLSTVLDFSTLRILSSSHDLRWSFSDRGVVDFYFDSINLVPSVQDEDASQGFVKYVIRCRNTTKLGDGIANTAYIYFDFNAAIITNTTSTIVSLPLVNSLAKILPSEININVYPNPTKDILHINTSELDLSSYMLCIYDVTGKLVEDMLVENSIYDFSTAKLSNGFYFGIITDKIGNKITNFRFIKNY